MTVLRVGPPPKGRVVNPVMGAVGLLLLIGTVALGAVLPVVEHLPNQFRVSYLPVEAPQGSQKAYLTPAAREVSFAYEVKTDDVYQIRVDLNAADDLPSTDPDSFVISLQSPDGNIVDQKVLAKTPPPQAQDSGSAVVTAYKRDLYYYDPHVFNVNARPADEVVESADLAVTEEQLSHQLQEKHHQATKGVWHVIVSLDNAGGCPKPPSGVPSQELLNRIAVCEQETSAGDPSKAGTDPGNEFIVGSFTSISFEAVAKKLGG